MRMRGAGGAAAGVLIVASALASASASASAAPAALIFPNPLPPAARLGVGGGEALRRDCEAAAAAAAAATTTTFVWEEDAAEGFQVASRLFRTIAAAPPSGAGSEPVQSEPEPGGRGSGGRGGGVSSEPRRTATVWFPSLRDGAVAASLADVVTANSGRLGGVTARAAAWPSAPATRVELTWDDGAALPPSAGLSAELSASDDAAAVAAAAAAVAATEAWVDGTLGRLGLCPHTRSMRRAAVGLDSVGVREGPVVVRHARPGPSGSTTIRRGTDAALLAAAFWEGVAELATVAEEDVATLLIVAPAPYDDNFAEFASTCDDLLEPAVRATGADDIVGRAWFHPLYESSPEGQSAVLPGHALPASMVEGFVDEYYGADHLGAAASDRPDSATVAKANDAVRHSPHATVNLLRRLQLRAAKVAEAASPVRRPNLIYARNVFRIAAEWEKE